MGSKLTYLASPYSHEDFKVRQERFRVVTQVAAVLMRQGELIYSPISHTHQMAVKHSLPTSWEFWQDHCRAFLSASSKMIVLQQDGWQESVGVQAEVVIAYELGLAIEHMEVPRWGQ